MKGAPVPLTRLGLGGAQLGNLGGQMSEDTAHEIFATAWESGIRYFDTAPHYGLGLSERRLGLLLRGRPRNEVTVSSKVGRLIVPGGDNSPKWDDEGFAVRTTTRRRWDFSRDGVRRSVEASLERLGLDRLDIAFLHDPEHHWEQALSEGLPALRELRDEGTVGAIGAGMNLAAPLTELVSHHDVDLVMCAGRHTLLEQAHRLLSSAEQRDVGVVIAGAFNSGLLAEPRPADAASYDYLPAAPALVNRARLIAAVCEEHGVTLPEAALAFVQRHQAVIAVVVGANSAAQLGETVRRHRKVVPEGLWSDLAARELLVAGPLRRTAASHPIEEAP